MFYLPEEHREQFKEPFGTLFPELEEALPSLEGKTLYAVGDVVTHNLLAAGRPPEIAVIDGYTMRAPCNRTPLFLYRRIRVKNQAGTRPRISWGRWRMRWKIPRPWAPWTACKPFP